MKNFTGGKHPVIIVHKGDDSLREERCGSSDHGIHVVEPPGNKRHLQIAIPN